MHHYLAKLKLASNSKRVFNGMFLLYWGLLPILALFEGDFSGLAHHPDPHTNLAHNSNSQEQILFAHSSYSNFQEIQ